MMEIMAYASGGREFEVMADLQALGVKYWHGKRVEFQRRGKSRVAEPFEYPALPNYLHVSAPFCILSSIMDIRHLSRTVKFMHEADVRGWQAFERAADARYAEAQAVNLERQRLTLANASRQDITNAIAQYKAGDALEMAGGAFEGMLATFGRMVQRPGADHPMVEVNLEIFGRETTTTVDPLVVRKAG
jgi:transcription antitermination factor NusG